MLDEAGLVPGVTRAGAKPVLERGERAHPAEQLDGGSVERAGDVKPREARSPQDEQTAGDHEDDEAEVHQHDQLGH